MKKFLIIDGNSIVNRAFYGIRPLSTKSGIPTNAVYGFLTIIKKHLDSLHPDFMACAFDVHQPTFRHLEYDAYKGTRKGMPDELREQMPYAKRAAEALGFKIIECPGFEADDIIGTSARMAEENGIFTYILTGDRDSLQLITGMTNVILAKTKEDVIFDEAEFEREYGIRPSQFVDVKALMGDSSDNIPGVSGIGEKTALRLIQSAGDLDTLYGSENFFGQSASVCKKLSEGKDSAYLSRRLALISREAPICSADELFAERKTDAAGFNALCTELEFNGMAKKFGTDAEEHNGHIENRRELNITAAEKPGKYTSPAALYYNGKDAAVTDDGVNITVCENISPEDIAEFLRTNSVICHDFKTLLRTLHISGDGIDCVYDTMIAAYLLDPGKSKYTLESAALEYTGSEPSTPAEYAAAIYIIKEESEKRVAEYGMTSLMREIEIPLSKVLAEMEEVGFRIDPDGIRGYAKELLMQENVLADTIWAQAGHQFNINSPKQLGEVLFEEIGLPAGKKTKTGYSTDADTLEALRPYHTIISDILMYRQTAKLRGTYGDTLADQADENGRIHTKLNQTGTATGRLASSDPNLQNIPVRGEMGRELRKFFVAEDGYTLIDADYSQIELRLLAVLSDDMAMKKAFTDGEDIHATVASQVFGVDIDEVTPEQRRRAKAVNFGIVYGIGEFSLSKDLGITRKMAKEYIENYLATYSGVDRYLKNTVEEAKKNGCTTTMFSRRRNIPELSASNRNTKAFGERVAMNSPIQGTAADVIKIAMINVSQALKDAGIDARLIMQVHDELIVEAKEECASEAAEILVREMENAVKLSVPLTADCGVGKTWYDAK
ncbi:MAG: DNA polymerase I [Eubacteriales bacterium]